MFGIPGGFWKTGLLVEMRGVFLGGGVGSPGSGSKSAMSKVCLKVLKEDPPWCLIRNQESPTVASSLTLNRTILETRFFHIKMGILMKNNKARDSGDPQQI